MFIYKNNPRYMGCSGGDGNTGGGTTNNYVTVITNIVNFTGDVINSPVTITNVMNVEIYEGGLHLTIIEDYFITNNTIVLNQYLNTVNMTVVNNNVQVTNIQNQIKGGYRNTEEAKAGGVEVGQMYYLLSDNDPAMYSGVVIYIYQ